MHISRVVVVGLIQTTLRDCPQTEYLNLDNILLGTQINAMLP